jgi:hypothetical protein
MVVANVTIETVVTGKAEGAFTRCFPPTSSIMRKVIALRIHDAVSYLALETSAFVLQVLRQKASYIGISLCIHRI